MHGTDHIFWSTYIFLRHRSWFPTEDIWRLSWSDAWISCHRGSWSPRRVKGEILRGRLFQIFSHLVPDLTYYIPSKRLRNIYAPSSRPKYSSDVLSDIFFDWEKILLHKTCPVSFLILDPWDEEPQQSLIRPLLVYSLLLSQVVL